MDLSILRELPGSEAVLNQTRESSLFCFDYKLTRTVPCSSENLMIDTGRVTCRPWPLLFVVLAEVVGVPNWWLYRRWGGRAREDALMILVPVIVVVSAVLLLIILLIGEKRQPTREGTTTDHLEKAGLGRAHDQRVVR